MKTCRKSRSRFTTCSPADIRIRFTNVGNDVNFQTTPLARICTILFNLMETEPKRLLESKTEFALDRFSCYSLTSDSNAWDRDPQTGFAGIKWQQKQLFFTLRFTYNLN